ncbi:hypothetical protein PHYBOEH_003755 [Phytophthora boehmeriae]|uniref:PH domain-containing protein n=1 Tax=Phytophthora boehmeriae TaxID=109152 RepID=A0A8T1WUG0_9STRA|nr:hypothetical protein PHYBOEH_003755 [Phytophthora boehmeriae]
MEAGAAIVAKIAGVVSKWVSETTDGSGNTARINPDVSLQWIGRQLWAVTVSLPLTRSGELHEEHITLAHRINEAVAEISKREDASSIVSPLSSSTDALQEIPTEGYRDDKPTSTYTIDPRGLGEPQPLSPVHVEREQDADSSEDQEATLQTSPFSTLAAEDIDILRLSQAQMADKRSVDIEKSADDGDSSNEEKQRENESDQNDDEEDEEEDNSERVAALPLSWSMLSLSSQPSGSSEPASLLGEFTTADEDTITDRAAHLAPEKTGWLKKKKRKQHGLGSSWQPRYFELKGNRLYYFASEADGLPRGAVLLDNALVQRGRGDHAMNFSISSASSHRRLQVLKFSARLTHEVNL